MNPDAVTIMNRILVRETHSLPQYMKDAWPWTGSNEQSVLERLRTLIAEDEDGARRVSDYLHRRRASPGLGRFPEALTAIHFLALDHLLPRLIGHQRWAIDELEKDFTQLREEEAWNIVRELLDMKRRHLTELEQMARDYAGKETASTLR